MYLWDKMDVVYKSLEDELSQKIFHEKIEWLYNGKPDKTRNRMYEQYNHSRIFALEKFMNNIKKDCAVIGAGEKGKRTLRTLIHAKYNVKYFVDNDINKQGTFIDGVRVISFYDFVEKKEDCIAVIDNLALQSIFYNQLIQMGCDYKIIYLSGEDELRSSFGNIYFDLPNMKHEDDETFIDAGCFDGETTYEFIKWCKGRYSYIYAFEPMDEGYLMASAALKGINNVCLSKFALGFKNEITFFAKTPGIMGSCLAENTKERDINIQDVTVRSIDSLLNGNRVTFIKMDIEGAEAEALRGAADTIKKHKPKLAISLYHKKEDILEIPLLIKAIRGDYKLYLRCYSNKRWDFVLYAI